MKSRHTQSYDGQSVWIIGASSGIGRALAIELAGQGALIALSARSEPALQELNSQLGGGHLCFPIDVKDAKGLAETLKQICAESGRVDRVVMLASVYEPGSVKDVTPDIANSIIDINLKGCFNLINAVLPCFERQGFGQLALTASVAGYVGLPNSQPYAATKAATINLAESLKAEAGPHIDIKLINPGFVETPMTDKNEFKMPMIISPEQAAKAIAKDLRSNRFEIHFPKRFTRMLKFLAILPYALAFPLLKKLDRN